jgi:hypothetical protein
MITIAAATLQPQFAFGFQPVVPDELKMTTEAQAP